MAVVLCTDVAFFFASCTKTFLILNVNKLLPYLLGLMEV